MTLSGITLVSSNKSFGGIQYVYSHQSKVLACEMRFGVYVPPQAEGGNVKLPVLYYLSGLSCTEANFIQKAGAQKYAAQHGLIIVNPDTSPRNTKIVGEGADDLIGASAGWYLDSTEEPWKPHYKMFSYVTSELMEMVNSTLPVAPGKQSIMGHSMGGHGAFICALKKPGLYKSVSAFAPIANPLKTDWGVKAFKGYLGEDQSKWNEWDSTELVKQYNGPPLELYIDQVH